MPFTTDVPITRFASASSESAFLTSGLMLHAENTASERKIARLLCAANASLGSSKRRAPGSGGCSAAGAGTATDCGTCAMALSDAHACADA